MADIPLASKDFLPKEIFKSPIQNEVERKYFENPVFAFSSLDFTVGKEYDEKGVSRPDCFSKEKLGEYVVSKVKEQGKPLDPDMEKWLLNGGLETKQNPPTA